ncbi:helix-turn-helix transcriptional regulator [Streptomyces sp. NPDC049881]|uniref:helix-turn-helix domain-containing protein n=1 Tax=Streptomyces sp. NPDC049881 TaxID=3155778 RepID=UPI00343C1A92
MSTVLGRRLGSELLHLREALGLRQSYAAEALSASVAKVAKMENGLVPMRDPDIRALCSAYGVTDTSAVDRLCKLASIDRDRRKAKGWWRNRLWEGPMGEYVAMESIATHVRSLQVCIIPGLLQTPDYVRALFHGQQVTDVDGRAVTDAEPDLVVDIRRRRQHRLEEENPLALHAIVWEAAFHQMVGGPDVMREQLGHMIDMATRPNVRLQVIPFASGARGCPASAFNILTFDRTDAVDVVYADSINSSFWAENETDGRAYSDHFRQLSTASLDDQHSIRLIEQLRKDM